MKPEVKAAQAAIDAHNESFGLERGQPASVDLWHLIYSLLDWCDENAVDFDAEVSAVRAEYNEAA